MGVSSSVASSRDPRLAILRAIFFVAENRPEPQPRQDRGEALGASHVGFQFFPVFESPGLGRTFVGEHDGAPRLTHAQQATGGAQRKRFRVKNRIGLEDPAA